jgi:hypothetical protein
MGLLEAGGKDFMVTNNFSALRTPTHQLANPGTHQPELCNAQFSN